MIMFLFLFIVFLIYALSCLWLIYLKPISDDRKCQVFGKTFLSVIIPVRNESANIEALLTDISNQTYPKNIFEVIVVDDSSDDETVAIIKRFQEKNILNLRLILLTEKSVASPKKRAIETAIEVASGILIITTDGDCRVGEKWLETIEAKYTESNAKMLSGPVAFSSQNNWLSVFQAIEFGSLIGTGACLIKAGFPTMCNGANLSFEKSVFLEVSGYEGIDSIASGDDELLMAKIAQKYPDKIVFINQKETIVTTKPQPTLNAFYQQRIRWASKWNVNKRVSTMVVAIFVFTVNFSIVLSVIFWFLNLISTFQFVISLSLKFIPEFIFLSSLNSFLRQKKLNIFIPLVQIFYPFYVIVFGLLAQKKGYTWKARKLK